MCGIAGVFGAHDEAMLKRMGDAIAHRGPDGEGLVSLGSTASDGGRVVGFAHRRLSIIDVRTATSRWTPPTAATPIAYNGEVYNYLELRPSWSPSATPSHRLRHRGRAPGLRRVGRGLRPVQRHVLGLAIHDRESAKAHLARDHFGIKPLYVASVAPRRRRQPPLSSLARSSRSWPAGLVQAAPTSSRSTATCASASTRTPTETFFAGIEQPAPGELSWSSTAPTSQRRMFTRLRRSC